MSSNTEIRVEDVMTAAVVIAMAAVLAVHGRVNASTEGRLWEYSFIFFPAALLIFIAAVRYALGGGAVGGSLTAVGTIVRDWLPFGLFLTLYETLRLQVWNSLAGPDRDAGLLRIDLTLLGTTPAVAMQPWIRPWLTDLLAAAYSLHLLLPPLLAYLFYRDDLRIFREFLLAVFITGAIGSACYVAVPAVGPDVAFPQLFTVPLTGARGMQMLELVDTARAPHDVFPSLHITISAIVLYYARRRPMIFWIFLPLVLGNWISTLYLRYHYFIDVLAGFALVPIAIVIARGLLQLEQHWRARPSADRSVA